MNGTHYSVAEISEGKMEKSPYEHFIPFAGLIWNKLGMRKGQM